MPEPMTAPIPRNVKLQGPRVFRRRRSGSSDDAISSSMLLVRNRDAMPLIRGRLTLTLALDHLLHFALRGAARDIRGPFGLGRGLLAGGAFQFFAFVFIRDLVSVHSTLIPAYFAISF